MRKRGGGQFESNAGDHFAGEFPLSRRFGVKFVSEQENIVISELANCFGICATDKPRSARAMFMTNKKYFENCELEMAIRENEYGYLMLNKMSEVLFGPKWPIDE